MYTFKYHLVTICAVFLALAVGLLLGAAVGGSGIFSATTSDLVDSLFDRYSDLSNENSKYELESSQYQSLSGEFVAQWQQDKLADHDVLILAGPSSDDANISREVAGYVSDAGGRYAIVHVALESFGLADEEKLAQLQAVLPPVDGQDYYQTLADALCSEWTAGVQTEATFGGGSLSSQGQLSEADAAAYPVTACLLSAGIISIEGSSAVPDSFDCCVNIYAAQAKDNAADGADASASTTVEYSADPVAARVATGLFAKGGAVVFTQSQQASASLMDAASSAGVAGVSSYSGNMGRYSIIALLSSRGTGVYGPDRDAAFWYPPYSE